MSYSSTILADSPVGYWRLGESSGTVAADASGNGRDGVYHNGPTLGVSGAIAGDADTAASFDGVDDYVAVPYLFNSAHVTWEAWIYLTAAPAGPVQIVGCEDGLGNAVSDKVFYIDSSARPHWYVFDGAPKDINGAALSLNAWHHLVGTADGTTTILYVDGVSAASASAGSTYTGYTTNNVFISGNSSGNWSYFPGRIDEAALYNAALSSSRVAAHYAAGTASAGPHAPPICAWPRILQGASVIR